MFLTRALVRPRKPDFTWGTAGMVREPLDLLVPHICHHLNAGARSVTLYFDDPDDPAAPVVATIPGVNVVICDDAYWASHWLGERPADLVQRQYANIAHAKMNSQEDWLMHIDADEFLWAPKGIEQDIARLEPGEEWLAIKPLERFWIGHAGHQTFGGSFRTEINPNHVAQVYGSAAPYLNRHGFTSYTSRKTVFPTSMAHVPRVHGVRTADISEVVPFGFAQNAKLLHFPAISATHWAVKLVRNALRGHRFMRLNKEYILMVHEILAADDMRAVALAMHDKSMVYPKSTVKELRKRGKSFDFDLKLERSLKTFAPDLNIDLTTARLDRDLIPGFEKDLEELAARRDELQAMLDKRGYRLPTEDED